MVFLQAFLFGGALCALFQAVFMVTKLSVPKLLVIGLVAGGICAALGWCDAFVSAGGAGFSVMLVSAAQAIYEAWIALFSGAWVPMTVVFLIFAAVTGMAILAGFVRKHIVEEGEGRSEERAVL